MFLRLTALSKLAPKEKETQIAGLGARTTRMSRWTPRGGMLSASCRGETRCSFLLALLVYLLYWRTNLTIGKTRDVSTRVVHAERKLPGRDARLLALSQSLNRA